MGETVTMGRGAAISADGKYRYALWRDWNGSLPMATWVMLNPSTADAEIDDPTIRRCVSFSRRLGYGGLEVINVYAYRTTYPSELWRIRSYGGDVIGPMNREFQAAAMTPGRTVICAWGAHAIPKADLSFLPTDKMLYCLGTTKDGHPRHPLYIKGTASLELWNGPRTSRS